MEIDRERLAQAVIHAWEVGSTFLDVADAVLSDITAQGWVLVPKVATEEMVKAGLATSGRYGPRAMAGLWSAMIEAVHPIHAAPSKSRAD